MKRTHAFCFAVASVLCACNAADPASPPDESDADPEGGGESESEVATGQSALADGAASLPLSAVPRAVHRRAARHLASASAGGNAPSWQQAVLGGAARPIYRPDLEAPAYYEIKVNVGGDRAGFIVVSAGDHDFPIVHWSAYGQSPTERLLAAAGAGTVARFYKLDDLTYVAEGPNGELLASSRPGFARHVRQLAPGKGDIRGEGYYAAGPVDAAGGWSPSAGQSGDGHVRDVLPSTAFASGVIASGSYPASSSGVVALDMTGTGDADLYVRKGAPPTLSTFDCRPYTGASQESCRTTVAAGDQVYWMVRGYSASSTAELRATDEVLPTATLEAGMQKQGVFPATGTGDLVLSQSGTGDADLYVKVGSPPTVASFDCRPYTSSSVETCKVATTPGTQVYWMVRGYSASSQAKLTALEMVEPVVVPVPSWSEMKAHYAEYAAIEIAERKRAAAREWTVEQALTQSGKGLVAGGNYLVPLLFAGATTAVSGDTADVSYQRVTMANGQEAMSFTVLPSASAVRALSLSIGYGPGVAGEQLSYSTMPAANVNVDGLPRPSGVAVDTSSPGITCPVLPNWISYNQIPANTGLNGQPCWSGCTPTAWSILVAWADRQVATGAWGPDYWGLFRDNGSVSGVDAVAPNKQTAGGLGGDNSMQMEMHWDLATFCTSNGEGATWNRSIGGGATYVQPRAPVDVSWSYDLLGGYTGGVHDSILQSVCVRRTPSVASMTVIGGDHSPVVTGFEANLDVALIKANWSAQPTAEAFYLNMGWGSDIGEWYPAQSRAEASLVPRIIPGLQPNPCASLTDPVQRICCNKPRLPMCQNP